MRMPQSVDGNDRRIHVLAVSGEYAVGCGVIDFAVHEDGLVMRKILE